MSSNKSCTNCPGATDHDTAHCPLRVIRLGDLNPEQRLALARGHHPEQTEGAQGEPRITWAAFDAAEKIKLSDEVLNEEHGPMGATKVERFKFADDRIVRAEWSMGGVSFFVEQTSAALAPELDDEYVPEGIVGAALNDSQVDAVGLAAAALARGHHPEQTEGAQGEREAFEAYRDRRNALLESEGHKPGSKWHVTQAHYPTWTAARAALAQPSSAPDHVEQALGMVAPELGPDDQAFDRNAERLTAEAFGTGGGINPQATSIDDLFFDEATAPELERPEPTWQFKSKCGDGWKETRHENLLALLNEGYEIRQAYPAAQARVAELEKQEPVGYRARFLREPENWMVNWGARMPAQPNPAAEYQLLYASPIAQAGQGVRIMNDVKRYTNCVVGMTGVEMVRASNFDALEAEAQALREEVAALRAMVVVVAEKKSTIGLPNLAALQVCGWNACLDELARLNGKAVSEGLLRKLLELIEHGDFSEGHCMCGSAVDSHGIGDGHAPVDAGEYYAGQVMEELRALLGEEN